VNQTISTSKYCPVCVCCPTDDRPGEECVRSLPCSGEERGL